MNRIRNPKRTGEGPRTVGIFTRSGDALPDVATSQRTGSAPRLPSSPAPLALALALALALGLLASAARAQETDESNASPNAAEMSSTDESSADSSDFDPSSAPDTQPAPADDESAPPPPFEGAPGSEPGAAERESADDVAPPSTDSEPPPPFDSLPQDSPDAAPPDAAEPGARRSSESGARRFDSNSTPNSASEPAAGSFSSSSALSSGFSSSVSDEEPTPVEELRFNFKGVPLETVLQYLSRAAGFVIVQTVEVSGRVNMVSRQPLTSDEAVALLNTVLMEQGFAAVRSGRTLTIVKRDEARTRDIPVRRGNNPDAIERSDEVITQIIPVRQASVKELVDNLRELLPSSAVVSANEKSNAIILTDTQTSVRRIIEVIRALDESISEITSIRVFRLQHADAKDTAALIKEMFKQPTQSSSASNLQRSFMPPFMREGRGDQSNNAANQSVALQAASTVNAAADERTNSVVVSAPEDLMPTIEKLVDQIDRSSDILTEVRVFPLHYADAQQMADVILGVFGDQQRTSTQNQGSVRQRFFGPGGLFGGQRGGATGGTSSNAGEQSSREKQQATVLAVADTRTNSVVVSAIGDTMQQIAQVVAQLDRNPAKTKRVYVYSLENADPQEVSTVLKDMFATQGSTNASRNTNRANTNRNNTNRNNTNRNNTNRNSSGSSGGSRTSR